jgi:hypothetical protein
VIRKYGYYIPLQDKLCGDQEFANQAKQIWDLFGINKKFAGRYDGVSIFLTEEGQPTKRLLVQDFFSEKHKVISFDIKD